jgi:hypothetical protein
VDGTPTGPGDECHGAAAFRIDSGNSDGVDLSGVKFGLVNYFPSNITSGNWKMGLVIDAGSDEQAQAVERIISGQAGGPFAEFAPLIGEFTGAQRGSIDISDKGASIEGVGEYTYDQIQGADGAPTVSRNAMFGFAPEFRLGRTSGSYETFGSGRQASYGESAEFEYSSEGEGQTVRA